VKDAAPAFELRGLRQAFRAGLGLRRREVLHGIDLALPRGATLGLVGPNGSGKSTLLRCLAGIDRPRAGELEVLGARALDSAVRARIGYLPEDSPFPPELSALAAMVLLGTLQRMPRRRAKERGAELLARVGLAEHARRPLRSYSRGMKRRFGRAQAWLHEPELILLDEPTAGLDAPGFVVLEELLAGARARGASVVLSSHLFSDLTRHCDELAVLIDGRIVERGRPAERFGGPGRWTIELEGLDEARIEELAAWVADHGGTLRESSPSGRTLLDLYRRPD
jgi:ABC-2 type transport system ATP-binding protein